MTQPDMEPEKMLDVYIYDYLLKRKFNASADAFLAEAKVSTDVTAIDTPAGFLLEWWFSFWDIFMARFKHQSSDSAASYLETQIIKAQEHRQQKQQLWHQKSQQQHMQQMLLQHLLQRQIQQQQQQGRGMRQLQNNIANRTLVVENSVIPNASATNLYEEGMKLPDQKDPLDDADMKKRIGGNVGKLLDLNHGSISKSVAVGLHSLGQLHDTPRGNSRKHHSIKNQNWELPLPAKDMEHLMNPMMSPRAAISYESLVGVHGSDQGVNNLPLKGWPLLGLGQLRPSFLQQQKSASQTPQPFHQLPLQALAQQNFASSSASDLELGSMKMLLDNGNVEIGRDGQLNSIAGMITNDEFKVQVGCPVLPHGGTDMLIKLQQQYLHHSHQQQQQQQLPQHPLVSQQSQDLSYKFHNQDKINGAGSITLDASLSNISQGNDQASKDQTARKRKQPVTSSGPSHSSGTANTTIPSPSSVPLTPLSHSPDVILMPTMPHDASSKPSYMSVGTLASAQNQLANVDYYVHDRPLNNVESFLSNENDEPHKDTVSHCEDASKEIGCIHAGAVNCCHFSFNGKLLATGGNDKKAVLWCTDLLEQKSTLEEHSHAITNIRFSPSMLRLATSSLDKTVRVWDVDNPGYSLQTFMGHSASVMSLDFHPNRKDLICSCDDISEIRYWNIKSASCVRVLKGGGTQVRFQPNFGRYLAAVVRSGVSIIDVETQACIHALKGHATNVQSVCWDPFGEYLASVSEDLVRVSRIGSGREWDCIYELSSQGKTFHCCVFHPNYPSLLVIGSNQSLDLWNMGENKMMSLQEKSISALASSQITGLIASASHDNIVKLWK